jgi:radical SAM protein with 4Fe4S-binding SPASM domain
VQKVLKKTSIFVKGAKNAAIYDLTSQNVYALNEVGKEFVEIFTSAPSNLCSAGVEYIEKLDKLGLIEQPDNVCGNIKQFLKPNYRLNYAWLELTSRCNLHCLHCYGQFGVSHTNSTKPKMSTGDWKQVIKNIKASGGTSVQFIGGEPLCYDDLTEILNYTHSIGMERIGISTNGTLVNENFIQIAKLVNLRVKISLYGHNALTHESITGVMGSFEKTKNTLRLLKKHDIPTTVAVIIMKSNQSCIEEIKLFIESLGHSYSGYDTIRQVSKKVNNDNCTTNIEVLKPCYKTCANFHTSEDEFSRNLYSNSCWHGKLAVTDSGDVLPCIFARDMVIGNVLTDSFLFLLNKAVPYWEMNLDQVDDCKNCEYRYACHNCRPLAMAIGGTLKSKEARCCYNPYTGQWLDIQKCTKELVATNL